MNTVARRFVVSGEVQGVGYRFFACRMAETLDVKGYVRNLADGSVEVYAAAPAEILNRFREELVKGPRFAQVTHVFEEHADLLPNLRAFDLRF